VFGEKSDDKLVSLLNAMFSAILEDSDFALLCAQVSLLFF
jgi:hypothetical protein